SDSANLGACEVSQPSMPTRMVFSALWAIEVNAANRRNSATAKLILRLPNIDAPNVSMCVVRLGPLTPIAARLLLCHANIDDLAGAVQCHVETAFSSESMQPDVIGSVCHGRVRAFFDLIKRPQAAPPTVAQIQDAVGINQSVSGRMGSFESV